MLILYMYIFCMWNFIVELMNYCIRDKLLLVNLVFIKNVFSV